MQTTAKSNELNLNKVVDESDYQRCIQMENESQALKLESETLQSRVMRLHNQRELLNTLSAEDQHEFLIEFEEANNANIILNRKMDEFSKAMILQTAYLLAKYPCLSNQLTQ